MNARGRLASPPLIIPEKMPEQIIGVDYDLIKGILTAFKKSGMNWDDYSKKLEPGTQEILKRVFHECRCNGFFNPHIWGDDIVFDQIVRVSKKVKKYGELTVKMMKEEFNETH